MTLFPTLFQRKMVILTVAAPQLGPGSPILKHSFASFFDLTLTFLRARQTGVPVSICTVAARAGSSTVPAAFTER